MELNAQKYKSINAMILTHFGMGWNVYAWKDTLILEPNALNVHRILIGMGSAVR